MGHLFALVAHVVGIPWGTLVLNLRFSMLCMRLKAWFAYAEVTKNIIRFLTGPKLRYPTVRYDFREHTVLTPALAARVFGMERVQRMCMREKAWLGASVLPWLARLRPCKQGAALASPTLHACGCARPSRACFGHKTVNADHL